MSRARQRRGATAPVLGRAAVVAAIGATCALAAAAVQSDAAGRWTATGAGESGTLTLRYGDGTTATYELRWDYQENHLYVDGERWLHGENEVCR